MKYLSLLLVVFLVSCSGLKKSEEQGFVLSFGSCNNNYIENRMWNEVVKNKPNVWVWGGDIVYADSKQDDMGFLNESYNKLKAEKGYKKLYENTEIIGSWDDHDYGLNDGGVEFTKKGESQQLFLDFMDVAKNDARRIQKGIYTSHDYQVGKHQLKIIILDTRYFRTALTKDPDPASDKRFKPNAYGNGTMLGTQQWNWLEDQLKTSQAEFNVILSSIQVLSPYHGFEKWANMPHELKKLESLIVDSKAQNVILLSGDRHISEFSSKEIKGLNYPLIDFTSSGINRALKFEKIESNPYRIGSNVSQDSFGILRFDFKKKQVVMEIRGYQNKVLHRYAQKY